MRWAGHVTQKGEQRNVYKVLIGKPDRFDDICINGSMMLRLMTYA
jgi:hypothetical protein